MFEATCAFGKMCVTLLISSFRELQRGKDTILNVPPWSQKTGIALVTKPGAKQMKTNVANRTALKQDNHTDIVDNIISKNMTSPKR